MTDDGVGIAERPRKRATGHMPTKPTEMPWVEWLSLGADFTAEVQTTRTIADAGFDALSSWTATILTNRNTTSRAGGIGGAKFYSFQTLPGEEICGIFGKSGDFIDTLGVHIRKRQ